MHLCAHNDIRAINDGHYTAFKSLGALLAPIEVSKMFFTKHPPKQLLCVKLEISPTMLSNSTENLKSGVTYKQRVLPKKLNLHFKLVLSQNGSLEVNLSSARIPIPNSLLRL